MRQLNIRLEASATFETWAKKPWTFGTRGHAPDGRVFRTAQAGGTALTVGRTAQTASPDVRLRNKGFAVMTSQRDDVLKLALNDVPQIETYRAGEFDEGLLYVVSGGGAGHVFRVAHSETGDAVNNELTIVVDTGAIKDQTRLVGFNRGTTRATLLKNRFKGLVIADAPPETTVAGVPPAAVTADQYFWLQTHGACAVLQDGMLENYRPIMASPATPGAVRLATVVVPNPGTVDDLHDAHGVAVVDAIIKLGDRGATRLAPVTGVGVVPEVQFGYVLDEGYDGAHALVHLAIEV